MSSRPAFEHFLITRWNIKAEFRPGAHLDPFWLDARRPLFSKFCLPSVAGQTSTNFSWVLLVDRATPAKHRDWLSRVVSTESSLGQRVHIVLVGDDYVSDFRSWAFRSTPLAERDVITTRLDSDDAIHREFVEAVQSAYSGTRTFVELARGYTYDARTGKLCRLHYPDNPYVSLIEPATPELLTVYCENHDHLREVGPFVVIDEPRGWLQVVHDDNVWNTLQGDEVPEREAPAILSDFGVRPLSASRRDRLCRWAGQRVGWAGKGKQRAPGAIRVYRRGVRRPEHLELQGAHPFVREPDGSIRRVEFAVDWLSRSGDILLHVNPRPSEGVVVLNACIGGVWGDEAVVREYPFEPERPLSLGFYILRDRFRLVANGRVLCDFPHRASPSKIAEIRSTTPLEAFDLEPEQPG